MSIPASTSRSPHQVRVPPSTFKRGFSCALLLMGLVSGGCQTKGLLFFEDRRLQIESPVDQATVTLPVNIKWTMKDFEVVPPNGATGPDQGHFGVFVDSAAPPPSKSLEHLFINDRTCRKELGCPSESDFLRLGLYQTTETILVLSEIPLRHGAPRGQEDFHEVTIVLLDGKSRRIGETSASVQFRLAR